MGYPMKLYLGIFSYFATGEGHHIILGTFTTEGGIGSEDPNWLFYYNHCRNWSHEEDVPINFENFKNGWDYYRHFVSTYLLEEVDEEIDESTIITHDLPTEAIQRLSFHFDDKHVEMLVGLMKHGLDKFKYELHYNLS